MINALRLFLFKQVEGLLPFVDIQIQRRKCRGFYCFGFILGPGVFAAFVEAGAIETGATEAVAM